MHGGKREGAGRKPGEPTKMIRVPVSLIPEFKARIEFHRKGLKSESEIKQEVHPVSLKSESEIKQEVHPVSLKSESEIKQEVQPVSVDSGPEIKQEASTASFDKDALRDLQRVPKGAQRKIKAEHGTLTNAVKAGVRAQRIDGKWRAVLPV